MACLSSSSSSRGHRLSELLGEEQEPFSLDIYLLEKGCSTRFLDGYDTTMCWPGNESKRLQRLKSKSVKNKRSSGVLRFLISKLLHGKAKRKAFEWDTNRSSSEISRTSSASDFESKNSTKRHEWFLNICMDEEEEEVEDSKQMSPVSVLDHPFDSHNEDEKKFKAMIHESPKKALDIFKELLEAAYTPALLNLLLTKSNEQLLNEDSIWDSDECSIDDQKKDEEKATSREQVTVAIESHKAELERLSELVASEIPNSRLEAKDVHPERREVGAEIEASLFEELKEELVLDILDMYNAVGRC